MSIQDAIRKYKIISIIRNIDTTKLLDAVKVMYEAGVKLFEITLNQKSEDTIKENIAQIEKLNNEFGNDIFLGAGTVMNACQVDLVYKAGAKYVISPHTAESVIKRSLELGLISVPGAFTPTEIAFAYACGAHFVKLFPAGTLGTKYIKDLKGPLGHIPLLAVGGVDLDNMKSFLDAGVCGVGIGSNLANTQVIHSANWSVLKETAEAYVKTVCNEL